MIAEVERYHGVVLRQLLVACGVPAKIGVANLSGRIDAFSVEGAACQLKHSCKRLSPWQFTYLRENLEELQRLEDSFAPVWVMLVCGGDGVVALSAKELREIVKVGEVGTAWVRVSRGRNSMYRVSGSAGALPRAKPRGLENFVEAVFGGDAE